MLTDHARQSQVESSDDQMGLDTAETDVTEWRGGRPRSTSMIRPRAYQPLVSSGGSDFSQSPSLAFNNPSHKGSIGRIYRQVEETDEPSPSSYQSVDDRTRTISSEDTEYLRDFRYRVSPWLDLSGNKALFGVDMLLLAKTDKMILTSALAFSACLKSCVNPKPNNADFENYRKYRSEAHLAFASMDNTRVRTCKALLLIGEFWCLSPSEWRTFLIQNSDALVTLTCQDSSENEIYQSMIWPLLRLG